MKVRSSIAAVLVSLIAVAGLGACGDAVDTRATPSGSSSVPLATIDPAVPGGATGTKVEDPGAYQSPGSSTVPSPEAVPARSEQIEPPNSADSVPSYTGNWQRHASTLHLADEPSLSTMTMGVSCCDTENWSATWTADGDGVIVTLVEQTALYGQGLYGALFKGKTFRASPSTSSDGSPILITDGLGDDPGISTWCRSGMSVPECGA